MKILWICGSAVLGGAERATLRVRVSSLLQERGHSVSVLCRRGGPVDAAARAERLAVEGASFGEGLDPRGYFAIHRALKAVMPDVALVTTVPEWLWSCCSGSPPNLAGLGPLHGLATAGSATVDGRPARRCRHCSESRGQAQHSKP